MKRLVAGIFLGMIALSVMGCTQQKPEGPAERIGRGVDEILGGLNEMSPPPEESSVKRTDGPYRDDNLNRYGSLREQWEAEEAARRNTVQD